MHRHFPSLWTALVFGLIWSLAWSLALTLIPVGITAQQAYGAALALSGAALAIVTTFRQGGRWTSILFALILLLLFGVASVGSPVRIIGSAAVLGWIRTAGRSQEPADFAAGRRAHIGRRNLWSCRRILSHQVRL